jgi:heme exporter protein A
MRVDALSIARGGRVLFENLSFAATPGQYVEIVGANGSGKTSLLRAIAGFLRPRAGRIAFDGAAEPALALHYIGHQNGLKPTADVRAHLRYWSGLFGGAGDEAALSRLALNGAARLPARALSQGQARRLTLARLLVAPRPIWLLDEPAAALDAAGREVLRELIDAHRAQGGIALAAVHEPLGPTPDATVTVA